MIVKKIGDVMNLYRIIQNAFLSRHEKEGVIENVNFYQPVVQLKREEVSFSSDEVVPLVEEGVLDTNDPLTIAKYKSNLQVLKEEVLKRGKMEEFRLIREDNLFPYDWKWRVNSEDTYREYARSKFSYALRMAEARRRVSLRNPQGEKSLGFDIPTDSDEESREASMLGSRFGQIYEPAKFRSTKHFTINLPLPYTGSYNQVSSGRNFVVIDKPDAFCQSGYGYSADYQDAYLDVTHEALPISEEAIVLMEESKYQEVIRDSEIAEQLKDRRVILYRGDEATAINMVLTQEGILPYRSGGKYMDYDSEIEEIMVQSMQEFCAQNHLEYAHGHGNMFGTGGHFSDLYDGDHSSRQEFENEFISFMQQALPEYRGLINSTFYQYPDKIIQAIGSQKVLQALEAYNQWSFQQEKTTRKHYDMDRDQITPEIHTLFVDTLQQIRNYYAQSSFTSEDLHQAIALFFHSSSVQEQIEAAHKVQELLLVDQKQY